MWTDKIYFISVYNTTDCNLVRWSSLFDGLQFFFHTETIDECSKIFIFQASLLLTAGTPGLRHSLPNSLVKIQYLSIVNR